VFTDPGKKPADLAVGFQILEDAIRRDNEIECGSKVKVGDVTECCFGVSYTRGPEFGAADLQHGLGVINPMKMGAVPGKWN
jgi:hypothetical protein